LKVDLVSFQAREQSQNEQLAGFNEQASRLQVELADWQGRYESNEKLLNELKEKCETR
jgi:hypothetical protein